VGWHGRAGGAMRFPIRPSPFHRYRQRPDGRIGLEANYVSSAFEDSRGSIWAGGKGIVNRIDRNTGQFFFLPRRRNARRAFQRRCSFYRRRRPGQVVVRHLGRRPASFGTQRTGQWKSLPP